METWHSLWPQKVTWSLEFSDLLYDPKYHGDKKKIKKKIEKKNKKKIKKKDEKKMKKKQTNEKKIKNWKKEIKKKN